VNAPAPRWNEGVRELRFTFGEFRIATARLPAWILAGHFLDTPDALNELPAFADVPAHVQVLAIQSLAVARDLPRVTLLPDAIRYVPAHFSHHCIELTGSFEDYLQRLSGKSRHEMARKARRFCAHSGGRHEVREFRDPADMAEFVRIAGALSRATYQGRLLHVGLPDDAGFVRELEEAAARDDIRGYVVTIGDRPQAFGYCRASGDVLVFEHTGYDPATASSTSDPATRSTSARTRPRPVAARPCSRSGGRRATGRSWRRIARSPRSPTDVSASWRSRE
jgi:hypothetical protein